MAKNLKITGTQVGPFPKGRVISAADLKQFGADDPSRFIKKGVIVETDEPLTEDALPPGPLTMGMIDPPGVGRAAGGSAAPQGRSPQGTEGLHPPDGGRAANQEDSGSISIDDETSGVDYTRGGGKGTALTTENLESDEDDEDGQDLRKMNKEELVATANEAGVQGADEMTKAELVKAIKKAQAKQ